MIAGFIARCLTLVSVIVVLAFGSQASTLGDQVRPANASADVLPALLVEVRGLRAVMEQMAAAGPRVQLALGRVQLQEQRINNLIRRLDEVRGTLAGAQTTYDRMRQEKSLIEEALRDPRTDGPHLEQLKDRQVQMAQELASAQTTLQRAIADEASMTSELSAEQARWTELNQRMEALEASLGQR